MDSENGESFTPSSPMTTRCTRSHGIVVKLSPQRRSAPDSPTLKRFGSTKSAALTKMTRAPNKKSQGFPMNSADTTPANVAKAYTTTAFLGSVLAR